MPEPNQLYRALVLLNAAVNSLRNAILNENDTVQASHTLPYIYDALELLQQAGVHAPQP